MNTFLLYPDRDLELPLPTPPNRDELIQDLELQTLFDAMALGDRYLREVASGIVLDSLTDIPTIRHRQEVLEDCLRAPAVVRDLYAVVCATIEETRKRRFGLFDGASTATVLRVAVHMLDELVDGLRRIRSIGDHGAIDPRSPGLSRFFSMIRDELSDEYFATIADQLEYLRFRSGVVTGAELGPGNKGARYTLRRTRARRGLRGRVGDWRRGSRSSFEVAPRDDAGLQTLTEIRGQALGPAANALARSADHVFGFFTALRGELAFYVACLNLYEGLARKGEPTCVPEPAPRGERSMSARGLYDICLSMHLEGRAVGNDLEVEDALLVVITGANQGGKSTMLRSVGLAQLLMQCGMRVPAIAFTADVREGIFTHFKREEDATMQSGKLDEELQRMSEIVDAIGPHSILLCNESFAATNEREGSELARQLVQALVGVGIKVFFVTHLFDLADGLHRQQMGVFLRAERLEDGSRTFRVVPGAPLPTSHGRDLFDRILGSEEHPLYARTLDE